jgi:hypothetical protein
MNRCAPLSKLLHDLIAELLNGDPKRRPPVATILNKPPIRPRVQRLLAAAVSGKRGRVLVSMVETSVTVTGRYNAARSWPTDASAIHRTRWR